MVHVNISVCSRVGIPATGACVGHPACGYDDFFGGESWFFPIDDSGCLMCIKKAQKSCRPVIEMRVFAFGGGFL